MSSLAATQADGYYLPVAYYESGGYNSEETKYTKRWIRKLLVPAWVLIEQASPPLVALAAYESD
jgi:hypothetical protein